MKIWLFSNLHLNCGIGEYGRDLAAELRKWGNDVTLSIGPRVPAEIVLVNWHNGRIHVTPYDVKKWQSEGSKVVIILHNSWSGAELGPENLDILACADVVVAHEPMKFKPEPKRFCYIKHGLTTVENLPEVQCESVGTAGFPFQWKRTDLVACVAKELGIKCRIAAPRHDSEPTDPYVSGIAGHLGPLGDIRREWMPKENVIRLLASCTMNIFWYESRNQMDELGQSGSVLMGVAAGRPMIISRHRKFRVLIEEYPEEFYVADTDREVYTIAREILNTPENELRRPWRAREDMSWEWVGHKFQDLLQSLVEEKCESD